jgi:hypothetical protein
MNDAIIGGAIAAVLGAAGGAITGLCLEHHREKTRQLAIVDALIIETADNMTLCKTRPARECWWLSEYRLEAYRAYKSQIFFLPEDMRMKLVHPTFFMEGCNISIQMRRSQATFGPPVGEEPIPPPPQLYEQLESINKELRKWRWEHRGFVARLNDFISKIRINSGSTRS